MAKPKITIVGLGLIGKSIGKALRAVGGQIEVMGHDREPMEAKEAQQAEAVDKIHWNLISACEGADVVIIATPLRGRAPDPGSGGVRSEIRLPGHGHRASQGAGAEVGRRAAAARRQLCRRPPHHQRSRADRALADRGSVER